MFCEYLAADAERIRRAAYSAMRLLISHGLKCNLLWIEEKKEGAVKTDIESILSGLDQLTISEEIENVRNDRRSKRKYSS